MKLPEIEYAITSIREFLLGTDEPWDWDDLLSVPLKDPEAARIQGFCRQLRHDYPPSKRGEYFNSEGREALARFLKELEAKHPSSSVTESSENK